MRFQAARKSTSSERLPSKEENKVQISRKSFKEDNKAQTSIKKITANGTFDDPERSNKPRISIGKKSSGELVNNGFLANLIKVPLSNRKVTEGNVSWASLPSSLGKLGKVHIQFYLGSCYLSCPF